MAAAVLDTDTFRLLLLLLALHAGNRTARGAADLSDNRFLLVFWQVFDQKIVGAFQFGIAVDLFQDTFPNALLAIQFAHLVENDAAFKPFAWHGLDVTPILRVLFDVGINLGIHLRV